LDLKPFSLLIIGSQTIFEIPLSTGRMVSDPIIKRENGLRSNYQEAEWFEIQLSRGRMV
jgi:hypothetical protein